MTRRNTQTNQVIDELGLFIINELGIPYEAFSSGVVSYVKGDVSARNAVTALWDIIQQNDLDPEPRAGDYIGNPQLASLASAIVEGNEDGE